MTPDRIHLISAANPLGPDSARFGFQDVDAFLTFAREHVADRYRLTFNRKLLHAFEQEWHGGRRDDTLRIRDLNAALADARTRAIVATNGGAYLARILPHIDLSPLARRRTPLYVLGFSELSGLVNLAARYACGRALYWLCPTWLGWAIRPRDQARAALAEFWQSLADVVDGDTPRSSTYLRFGPVEGEVVAGRVRSGPIRLAGGCLAVLAAVAGGRIGRRIRPDGRWLMLEDIKEVPHRIDRHLAALKVAGWFDRVAGVLIGDFHVVNADTQAATLELLRFHLPPGRRVPVVTTRSFGHVWPMVPVPLGRRVPLRRRGGRVTIGGLG